MGIAGLSIAWRLAIRNVASASTIATVLAWAALAVFAALVALYSAKLILHPSAVRAEWTHPVKAAFTPALTIAALVLAGALLPLAPVLAEALWWAGAAGHLVVTLYLVGRWIAHPDVRAEHIHPGWFLAPVGNVVAPIVGVSFASTEVVWFFFGVGLVYWFALLPLVLHRLFTLGSLPPRLLPSLAILISPPSVAAIAWVALGGTWAGPIARVLLGVAVFQALLLLALIPQLRRAPFAPSAWAYTFPLAALTIALLSAAEATGNRTCLLAGAATLGAATLVVAALAARTAVGLTRHEICRAEPATA